MSTKLKCALDVSTGPCSFREAAEEAIALAKRCEFVTFTHGGHTVDVHAEWHMQELISIWQSVALESGGRGRHWRRMQSKGHRLSDIEVAEVMHTHGGFAESVSCRLAYLGEEST